ncbi:hypothetical protein BUALT_Bualt03G0059400 [Buddleja alternifolia]|uniref:Uncharacterized protein n=1 Tax=Buddleja alternifolia TaxID=168488 RepID=A0AAV6Y2P2_9LAMI|nr:hypothetical protein BUALT_Bualt03G0059400 [Buddleja alternifolia]
MGFVESFGWMQKKQYCRTLFWKIRAGIKKAVRNGRKQKFKFQYDPYSYALNFDDGSRHQQMMMMMGEKDRDKFEEYYYCKQQLPIWVYVLWVEQ